MSSLWFRLGMLAAFALGCGSGAASSTPGGGGSGSSGGGGSGSLGDGGSLGAASPECITYCTTVMTNCTAETSTQQYDSTAACLGSCATFPVGTSADQNGNTLGCRTNHGVMAKDNPPQHCSQAGPGGDGVCGEHCDGYCQIALAHCAKSSTDKLYADLADCQASCAKAANDLLYNTTIAAGDHVACLLFHAQAAAAGESDAHCRIDLAKDPTDPTAASQACR